MQKRGPAVKKALLDAAARSYRARGYQATSVDAIAKEAGVSKATLYAHFGNKEGLFRATVRDFVTPLLRLLPQAAPVDDLRAELISFAQQFSTILMTPEKVAWDRMMVATAKQFPALAQDYFSAGPQRALEQLAQFLKAQHKAGGLEVPDPEFSAEMLCGMLFGARMMRNLISPAVSAPDQSRIERTIDAFIKVHTS